MPLATLHAGLITDRRLVDAHLIQLLATQGRSAGVVLDAMRYAVLGPAQRIRPILALRVARRECARRFDDEGGDGG